MGTKGTALSVGPATGSRLIFEPVGEQASIERAAELARDPTTVWMAGQGGGDWIVARGQLGVLRLVRGEGGAGALVEVLRGIEQSTRGDDIGLAAIFGGLLAAEHAAKGGVERIAGPPSFFADFAEEREVGHQGAWTQAELEERVRRCLDEVARGEGLCRPGAGPLDSAGFWLHMGEMLWDPQVRTLLGGVHVETRTRRILMMLAGAWMSLASEGKVRVKGSLFRLHGAARGIAWPQVMEWEAGGVSEGVLEYVTAYHRSFSFDGILMRLLGLGASVQTVIAPLVAAHESRSLLEEAALKWTCDPFGSFRVDVPVRTPLAQWGVTSLRVWIVPHEGLWVGLEKDDEPGASLQWTVRPPHLRRWVLDDRVVPAMHLTLSALWRDLKVGGREVMLAEQKGRAEAGEKGGPGLRLYGRIRWGSREELAGILRQAYPVEEHVRVLARGKRATRRAYRRAMAEGVVLRPGTTFVRRHQRGKPEETTVNVPWKAKGLARLILASRSGADLRCSPGRR